MNKMDYSQACKAVEVGINDTKWASIFKQNICPEKVMWKNNMKALYQNTKKNMPDIAIWS